jgi:Flp pilus assembly secretin CpaC
VRLEVDRAAEAVLVTVGRHSEASAREELRAARLRRDEVVEDDRALAPAAVRAEGRERLAGDGKVVNGITVRGRDQVMLKVTVAEVRLDVIKQLGIDSGSLVTARRSLISITAIPSVPGRWQLVHLGYDSAGTGSVTDNGDGTSKRNPNVGRAKSHGHFRRDRQLSGRRRVSGTGWRHLRRKWPQL